MPHYYNKPSQDGLYRQDKTVAEAVAIPQVLNNVPGRTAVNILPETPSQLEEIPNIVAIKEATGSLQQVSEIIALCGDNINVLSGDDFTTFPLMACGGVGVISVTANITSNEIAAMINAFNAGNMEEARRLHLRLLKISNAMFIETNPVPVKMALEHMGKCSEEVRLPLGPMSEENNLKLAVIIKEYVLI